MGMKKEKLMTLVDPHPFSSLSSLTGNSKGLKYN